MTTNLEFNYNGNVVVVSINGVVYGRFLNNLYFWHNTLPKNIKLWFSMATGKYGDFYESYPHNFSNFNVAIKDGYGGEANSLVYIAPLNKEAYHMLSISGMLIKTGHQSKFFNWNNDAISIGYAHQSCMKILKACSCKQEMKKERLDRLWSVLIKRACREYGSQYVGAGNQYGTLIKIGSFTHKLAVSLSKQYDKAWLGQGVLCGTPEGFEYITKR